MGKREIDDDEEVKKKQKVEDDNEDEDEDPDDRTDEGPFFEAVTQNTLEKIKELEKDESNKVDWEDVLYYAVQKGRLEIYDYIRPKLTKLDNSSITWMINLACEFGNLEMLKKMLKEEPNAKLIDPDDSDPTPGFAGACTRGHLHIVEFMLQDKAVVKMINDQKKEMETTHYFTDQAKEGKSEHPKGKHDAIIKLLKEDKRLKYK